MIQEDDDDDLPESLKNFMLEDAGLFLVVIILWDIARSFLTAWITKKFLNKK